MQRDSRHGRQEHRRVEVFDTAGLLDTPWQALVSCVARVSRLTYIKNTRTGLWATREEVGYYPCQIRHDAKILGGAIRAHWGIENRAHYVRDVALGEDASRIRTRPGVMAYGIHTFDWAADWAARAKPAAMAANCAHPARMVLGPGGL